MSAASKYDQLARTLATELGADAVVVVVVNGPYGHGACRAEAAVLRGGTRTQLQAHLAATLRAIADSIEQDNVPARVNPQEPVS